MPSECAGMSHEKRRIEEGWIFCNMEVCSIQLVIPRSLLRGQSVLVPSGVWRSRGTQQSERERAVRGKSTPTLSFP